jgi:hypothetical protein
VRVIVDLDVSFAPEGELSPRVAARQRSEIASARHAALAGLQGAAHRVRRGYETIPSLALEVDPGALAALARSPWVSSIQEDETLHFALDGTVPLVGADQAVSLGYDGAGQVVVVIDTGVDGLHPNLAGKLVDEACFAALGSGPKNGGCPNGNDTQFGSGAGIYCSFSNECDHGTHVAGIAVGNGPQFSGVAQGADLISIQVASEITSASSCSPLPAPCPQALVSDYVAALEYVYTTLLSHSIASVNISLAGQAYTSQASCDSANAATKTAIDNLRSVGIATAIAAGNGSLTNAIGAPACISSALSVGATTDFDNAWAVSNAASFLSLWAPGFLVMAPRWQSSIYVSKSGTSMAAPHVAGALAILRQVDPAASVSSLLATLQQTGEPISHSTATTTRIDVLAAVEDLTLDCDDGLDNDGDGLIDHAADPGCDDALDGSERSPSLICDDGLDNDGDGWIDHTVDADDDGISDPPGDPSCNTPLASESRLCQDGLHNDGDGLMDWDGGVSVWGAGHPNVTAPDPHCNRPWRNNERATSKCGLGFELVALLVPIVWWVRRRARS